MPYTIDQQIACVQREIRRREREYPPLVAQHQLSPSKAHHELACLKAVLDTLRTTQQHIWAQAVLFPEEDQA